MKDKERVAEQIGRKYKVYFWKRWKTATTGKAKLEKVIRNPYIAKGKVKKLDQDEYNRYEMFYL